jgi:hypothetical protein
MPLRVTLKNRLSQIILFEKCHTDSPLMTITPHVISLKNNSTETCRHNDITLYTYVLNNRHFKLTK